MANARHERLIRAIKQSIGLVDESGKAMADPDGDLAGNQVQRFTRPSREKIRALAKQMAADEARSAAFKNG